MHKSVGLPRMHQEAGEKRDFLPDFVSFLLSAGAREVVIEEGYGEGVGASVEDYLAAGEGKVRVAPLDECLGQDLVIWLRYPKPELLERIRPGAILVSMIHYPTRPGRSAALRSLGLRGVSLDSLEDDGGRRLVENLEAVGWNGVRFAFQQLRLTRPDYDHPGRTPIQVTVIGSGAVGAHAMRAASRYGDVAVWKQNSARGMRGVQVTVIEHDLTSDEAYMRQRLAQTDLLVDATRRPNPTRPVVRNALLGAMPSWAVLVDLSVDPYDFSRDPPQCKGLEGVPEGNLDQWIYPPDDPAYGRLDPRVDTTHRRLALSCYSWPGVQPRECMDVYGSQIQPFVRVLLERPLDALSEVGGRFFERAVTRADSERWERNRPS